MLAIKALIVVQNDRQQRVSPRALPTSTFSARSVLEDRLCTSLTLFKSLRALLGDSSSESTGVSLLRRRLDGGGVDLCLAGELET
jgi:hypothetical protein